MAWSRWLFVVSLVPTRPTRAVVTTPPNVPMTAIHAVFTSVTYTRVAEVDQLRGRPAEPRESIR